jgi:predicted adenylyl cyclase CyaB
VATNQEYELKYRISDLNRIEQKLLSLGSTKQKEFRTTDTYYILTPNPGGRRYLRVRESDNVSELSYSYAHSHVHTQEWETEVANPETVKEILEQLKFSLDVIVKKHRKVYTLDNCEIVLDNVDDLGSFIEIECSKESEVCELGEKLNVAGSVVPEEEGGYPDILRTKLNAGK